MTANQIKAILTDLGISSQNGWMRLPQISMFQMANDMREFPDKCTFYKFNYSNGTMLVSRGHTEIEEINDDNVIVDDVYNIFYIDGIIRTSVQGPFGSFYKRQF